MSEFKYMVMYTFGKWIKIHRHLTVDGYPKKACPQQFLQTVNEHNKYNIHKNNSYYVFLSVELR